MPPLPVSCTETGVPTVALTWLLLLRESAGGMEMVATAVLEGSATEVAVICTVSKPLRGEGAVYVTEFLVASESVPCVP